MKKHREHCAAAASLTAACTCGELVVQQPAPEQPYPPQDSVTLILEAGAGGITICHEGVIVGHVRDMRVETSHQGAKATAHVGSIFAGSGPTFLRLIEQLFNLNAVRTAGRSLNHLNESTTEVTLATPRYRS